MTISTSTALLNHEYILGVLKEDYSDDFRRVVSKTVQRINPQLSTQSVERVVSLSISDLNPFIKTVIDKLVIDSNNNILSFEDIKSNLPAIEVLSSLKQENEIMNEVQSPKFCLDNINSLVNENPDVFSYPLFGTFSTNKSSEKSTPVQKGIYSPGSYSPTSLLKKRTSEFADASVQQKPVVTSIGTLQKPVVTSIGIQGRVTAVRNAEAQTSNLVGLSSRIRGLRQKLNEIKAFPNRHYLNRVVIGGIPTGMPPITVGLSYDLTGFSRNNFKIHVTPRYLTNKVSSGQDFRLINYGFQQPTIALDTNLFGELRPDHPLAGGLTIGPNIPLKDVPGIRNTSLVQKLVQFSENQNPKSLNNKSIDNIIQNMGEENFQVLGKLMQNLPTKQAKGLEKSLEKSLGFPLKDILNQAKQVSSKNGSSKSTDECKCCVQNQNLNLIMGDKSWLVAGGGKTETKEDPKTEVGSSIPKQQGLSPENQQLITEIQSPEDQLVVTSHPNQHYYPNSNVESTLGLVFGCLSLLAFIIALIFNNQKKK